MKQQLLLLEDVEGLGRAGDVVNAKRGYIRNFLLPQMRAVIADVQTLKMQTRIKEERQKRAVIDKQESEELASRLKDFVLVTEVKVDPEGKMYGSVSALDIARMLQEMGYPVERRYVQLPQAIKTIGRHPIRLKLKETVMAEIALDVRVESSEAEQ
jgi:large subunit ribosomal protein L9